MHRLWANEYTVGKKQILSAGMWESRLLSCILLAHGHPSMGNEIRVAKSDFLNY